MAAQKRRKGTRTDPLLEAKKRLHGLFPGRALGAVRSTLDPGLYPELIRWIRANKVRSEAVFPPPFPRRLAQVKHPPITESLGLDRHLRWTAAILADFGPQLTEFVQLSTAYQRGVLTGRLDEAKEALDQVEVNLGQSIWLMKARIALLQEFYGLEAQKEYVAMLRSELPTRALIPYIAFYVSMRNEATVSAEWFYSYFNQHLANSSLAPDLKAYLAYHIAPVRPISVLDRVAVLVWEQAGTAIDLYMALKNVLRSIGTDRDSPSTPHLSTLLKAMLQIVTDPDIEAFRLQTTLTSPSDLLIDNASLQALEQFLDGDYHIAADSAHEGLKKTPDHPDLIVLAGLAGGLSGEISNISTTTGRLIDGIAAVATRSDDMDERGDEVLKITTNFYGTSWADLAAAFVAGSRSSDPLHGLAGPASFANAGCLYHSPLRVADIPNREARTGYALLIANQLGNRPASDYALAFDNIARDPGATSSFSSEQRSLLQMEAALRRQDWGSVIDSAENLSNSEITYFRHRSIRACCHALFYSGRIIECVRTMAHAHATASAPFEMLPVDTVVPAIELAERQVLSAEPALAIAYEMYEWSFGTQYQRSLRFAYEDFLKAHGVSRPTELKEILDRFDANEISYFLFYVATESVMTRSLAFSGSREVLEERAAICRLLVDISTEHEAFVLEELIELERRLDIDQQVLRVEQSKIHVDTAGIIRVASHTLKESYNRYASLRRHGIDLERKTFVQEVQQRAQVGDVSGLVGLSLPKSETSALFRSMVIEMRDLYVGHRMHGLDGYLSVRIRHGTLSGQVRSPVEAVHLITPRDEATGRYQPNDHWMGRLGATDVALRRAVDMRLSAFAEAFDGLISEILKEWIQVKRAADEKGMFDFSLSEQQYSLLSAFTTEETTFDEFVQTILGNLDIILEQNLARIRNRIEEQAKTRVNSIFTLLQADLLAMDGVSDAGIHDAIGRARTEVQVAFDRVREWFRISRTTTREPYPLDTAIMVAVTLLQTSTRRIDVVYENTNGEQLRQLSGETLSYLVDVFFTIFDNVVRRSGLPGPIFVVRIRVSGVNDNLRCRVVNSIVPGIDTEERRANVRNIQTALADPHYLSSVRDEGGTGFFKIAKILESDLNAHPELDFGFGNDEFYVEFSLSPESLLPCES